MAIRDLLLKAYWQIEKRIAPKVRYSQTVYEEVLGRFARGSTAWLDVGCGHQLLPPWRSEAETALARSCAKLVGVDPELAALAQNRSIHHKCQASATALPFTDAGFDLVTANMVVEHLDDPATSFREIARVTTHGGFFVLHTPNALGYSTMMARMVPERIKKRLARCLDGRRSVDVFRTFYRANSLRALKRLAAASSFRILEHHSVVSTAVFASVLPLAVFELIWLRILMNERLAPFRTNIIAVLEKV
jgi:ubiquinone/menaquinone biosynthesis C-methylase UbiE